MIKTFFVENKVINFSNLSFHLKPHITKVLLFILFTSYCNLSTFYIIYNKYITKVMYEKRKNLSFDEILSKF